VTLLLNGAGCLQSGNEGKMESQIPALAAKCSRGHVCARAAAISQRSGWPMLGLLLIMMFGSSPLVAETYFAIDGSRLSLVDESEEEINPGGLRFRVGTQLGTFVDVETHVGFSFSDDKGVTEDLTAAYVSGFLKGYVPIGRTSALFGMVGVTAASLSQELGRRSEFSEDRTGFSWGVGVETSLNKRVDLTADFVSYIRSDGLFEEISAFNMGLKFYFY